MEDTDWIGEYIELLRHEKFDEALSLKKLNIPSSLFRHQPLGENSLNCLESNAVWMSSADSLNDPYESQLSFNELEFSRNIFLQSDFPDQFLRHYGMTITKSEINDIIKNENPEKKFQQLCYSKGIDVDFSRTKKERDDLLSSFFSNERRRIKICSFTERNDSILMWSHYSDQHKGICIEYDINGLPNTHEYLEPAYYTDKLFDIMPYFGANKKLYTRGAITIKSISKAKDWAYEKEWRLTFPVHKEKINSGLFKVNPPKAIFLGTRFESNAAIFKNRLSEIAVKANIPIYKMTIHNLEYKMMPIL